MSTSVENAALLVNLIGIDQRNRNVIEMIFDKQQTGVYRIVSADESHVTIVDLDKYGAAEEWQALQQIRSDHMAILLSVDNSSQSYSPLFLKKPVLIDNLVAALEHARIKLELPTSEEQQEYLPWSKFLSSRINYQQEKISNITEDFEAYEAYEDICFLSENGYLLDAVKRAVVQASTDGFGIKLQIKNKGSIFIDPIEHWINTDLSFSELENICQNPLSGEDINKRVFSDREFSKYLEEWRASNLNPIDIDTFLWDLALWTYKGAIPSSTDLAKKIILSYWPDLARLTEIPNAMRIAALWVSCPMTLVETIDVLNVQKEDVFNFYTAALTIGLVQQSETIVKIIKTETNEGHTIKSDKSQRDFYLRILKHLKGQNQDS